MQIISNCVECNYASVTMQVHEKAKFVHVVIYVEFFPFYIGTTFAILPISFAMAISNCPQWALQFREDEEDTGRTPSTGCQPAELEGQYNAP